MKTAKKKTKHQQQKETTGVELPFGKRLHPLAELVPVMSDAEFKELVADVKANGLRDWITTTHDGKLVVDGRHRLLACEKAGVKPKFDPLPKNASIAPFIISKLIHRNLTASQRAAIAADLMSDLVKNDKTKGGTRKKAAKVMHVSEGYVHEAATLKAEDPEKFKDVKAGKLKLSKARPKKSGKPKKDKPPKVEMPFEAEQEQEPIEQQEEGSASDAKIFGVWEQAHQYLSAFVSYSDKLLALGEPVADLVVGARAMQKQFAKLRKESAEAVLVGAED